MKKVLLLFLLFQSLLFGCAACQLMTPTAEVQLKLNIEKTKLKSINVRWIFADSFVQTLLLQYDKNDNAQLDTDELKEIKTSMLEYLLTDEITMATQLKFASNAEVEAVLRKLKFTNFVISMQDNNLILTFDINENIKIQNNALLSLSFNDPNNFFAFIVTDVELNSKEFSYEPNLYLFSASLVFKEKALINSYEKEEIIPKATEDNETKEIQKLAPSTGKSQQENLLIESLNKVKELFTSIKDETNPLTYLTLLLFAYVYGLIHALGPGHGKTLVASYFLSNERSYTKALFVSLAIGVVHTFSAFILTLIIYFGVNSFLSQFMQDSVTLTTKISALIIIAIALYLIVKKYRAYRVMNKLTANNSVLMNFSKTPHPSTCGCGSCTVEESSTDFALIVSAGIIPCPGTTTIFIFALSLGLYFAGFLAALTMSLGMSTIIYASALLSVSIRQKTSLRKGNLKKYLEYSSLGVILILGVLLFLA